MVISDSGEIDSPKVPGFDGGKMIRKMIHLLLISPAYVAFWLGSAGAQIPDSTKGIGRLVTDARVYAGFR